MLCDVNKVYKNHVSIVDYCFLYLKLSKKNTVGLPSYEQGHRLDQYYSVDRCGGMPSGENAVYV